jgi:hypothetical protein
LALIRSVDPRREGLSGDGFDLSPGAGYSPLCVLFQVLKHDLSGSLAVAEAPYFPVLEIETSAGCDPIFFLDY